MSKNSLYFGLKEKNKAYQKNVLLKTVIIGKFKAFLICYKKKGKKKQNK